MRPAGVAIVASEAATTGTSRTRAFLSFMAGRVLLRIDAARVDHEHVPHDVDTAREAAIRNLDDEIAAWRCPSCHGPGRCALVSFLHDHGKDMDTIRLRGWIVCANDTRDLSDEAVHELVTIALRHGSRTVDYGWQGIERWIKGARRLKEES